MTTSILEKNESLIEMNPSLKQMSRPMIASIKEYYSNPSRKGWESIQQYSIGPHTVSSLYEMFSGSMDRPESSEFEAFLLYITKDLRIIRTEKEGKVFEAFVKMILLNEDDSTLVGISLAGSLSACRAIHALFYEQKEVMVTNFFSGEVKFYKSTRNYRRIEEVHSKVCHTFLLPRVAIVQEYNEACLEADANNKAHPPRILMSRGNINELAGQFIAQKFNLPKTRDWADLYLSLIPKDKWTTIKTIQTDLDDVEETITTIQINTMKEEEVLSCIDQAIIDGTLNVFSSTNTTSNVVFDDGMTTEDYLRKNAEILSTKMEMYLKPLYNGQTYTKYIGMTNRICLPAQARAVMGILTILKEGYSAFLNADMGCGKTQMSLTASYVLSQEQHSRGSHSGISVLITAPSITIPKWAGEEIPKVLGEHHTRIRVINSTEDALDYVRKVKSKESKVPSGTIEFVLVSTDRMKLTANKFICSAIWNHRTQNWRCPDCYQPIKSPKPKDAEAGIVASWKDIVEYPKYPPTIEELNEARLDKTITPAGLPRSYVNRYTSFIRQLQCECKSPSIKDDQEPKKHKIKKNCTLARPALKSRGEDRNKVRWMIAEIFQKHLKGHFKLGIFDEIQQMKASNSGRGLSFHKLLKSCSKAMFLTGTLTSGISSSIQSTLWRSDPQSLINEGFEHSTSKELWAQKYGVLEKVTYHDVNDGNAGRTTNRRAEKVSLKEKPGIAPQLVAKHLLHKSVFVELSDLGLPLVSLREEPVIVDLEDEHGQAYREFEQELYDTCMKMQSDLGSKAWSYYASAVLNYAAQPSHDCTVEFTDDKGKLLSRVSPKVFDESYTTAVEQKLVEDIRNELANDRGCIIFTNFTNKYKTNERIQKILSEVNIDATILDKSTTTSMGRFDWLEEQKQQGTKVLIMNAALVQVGLDLLLWPNLMFWQLNDDINAVRQAGRRAWRIGQTKECTVRFYVAKNTHQMKQFEHLMKKRIAALLVEGRIERSDKIAKFATDNESGLTRDLANNLSAAELTETWKSAAEKDIDEKLNVVSEEDYPAAINEAFKILTAETKRLCGVSDFEPEIPRKVEDKKSIGMDHIQGISVSKTEKTLKIDIIQYKTTPVRIKMKNSETFIQDQLVFDF